MEFLHDTSKHSFLFMCSVDNIIYCFVVHEIQGIGVKSKLIFLNVVRQGFLHNFNLPLLQLGLACSYNLLIKEEYGLL